MEIAVMLSKQVAVMFLMVALGIICKKAGILNEEHARALSNMLLLIVTPALVINSFQTELIPTLLPAMGITLVMAAVVHIISIFISDRICVDPGDGSTAWKASKMAIVFANAGFMGFPLLAATVGDVGLIYGATFLGIFNYANWAWGAPMLSGERSLSFKKIITIPVIPGFLVGFLLHLLRIRLPMILHTFVGGIASVNTPISMIVVGVFLASVNFREILGDCRIWLVSLTRNILIPLFTLLILWAGRVSAWLPGGRTFGIAFLIIISCPSAANTIMMSARYKCDSGYGAKLVAVSTMLSILTIPLVVALADLIL